MYYASVWWLKDGTVSHTNMSTVAKPVLRFISYFLTGSSVLWVITLACNRVFVLHSVYMREVAAVQRQEKLRVLCQSGDFIQTLDKFGPTVCTEAIEHALQSPLLYALKHVTATTYLCGDDPCAEYFHAVLAWFQALSLPLMVVIGAVAVFCPFVLVQLVRTVTAVLQPEPVQFAPMMFGDDAVHMLGQQYARRRRPVLQYAPLEEKGRV